MTATTEQAHVNTTQDPQPVATAWTVRDPWTGKRLTKVEVRWPDGRMYGLTIPEPA